MTSTQLHITQNYYRTDAAPTEEKRGGLGARIRAGDEQIMATNVSRLVGYQTSNLLAAAASGGLMWRRSAPQSKKKGPSVGFKASRDRVVQLS
jgi:hypothetical protein